LVLLKPLLKPAALSNVSRLASQTAVYGVSTILGRLLNYLLIPLHTYLFEPASYGVVGELYAYITFLNVVYLLGMETAFFHFANKRRDEQRVFSTALIALAGTSVLFSGTVLLFNQGVADLLAYSDNPEYIAAIAGILAFDTIAAILSRMAQLDQFSVRAILRGWVCLSGKPDGKRADASIPAAAAARLPAAV
jgi:O-antigen/teichoic acid export membrane protein